ncbi:MAG: FMN-dependent NADH-azoreductase [Carnobacterium sp.]|uniref:FMN-dependent NADH-azoreductase n=1 Tax=Carnobacterium sp. TaxID=48221 RepID=UPI0033162F58
MKKVLYITANPNDATQSYSIAAGEAFINSYKEKNPEHEVLHLDLYKENIPQIDGDVFSGWGKLGSGQSFEELTAEEGAKVSRLAELVEQFVAYDKYVFVTPLWNFSYPPVMKAYLDAVSSAGKTFRYSDQGQAIGLLTDKKALHIQARGGFYSEFPAADLESGHRHLQIMMQFFGVPTFEGLFVEGHNKAPEQAQEIKEDVILRAKELALNF